jgi:Na+-transporting NADH:ubiquinone oxidoreductase subunit A
MDAAIVVKRGLSIPITGAPVQDIKNGSDISTVGVIADDYIGMRPTLLAQVGDRVKLAQPLMLDKKTEGVIFTSPTSGKILEINRGEKRRFISISIAVEGKDEVQFSPIKDLQQVDVTAAKELLVQSGQWISFRTRPYNRIPSPASEAHSIFVTAMDTNPLSAEPELIISENKEYFVAGLSLISNLTPGKTFVCTRDDTRVPGRDVPGVYFQAFSGPHPAGLPGTHIHFLDPVGPKKTVWFINYQDVIAIGHLAMTGRVRAERVVALGGPVVKSPALYRTRLGAELGQFVGDRADLRNARVISGPVLCGRKSEPLRNYLGRYHQQVSVLKEGNEREFLGWQRPGADKFSVTRAYLGSWMAGKLFPMTTSTEGSKRAIVPIGTYERVMPLDVMSTALLKSLIVKDTDSAQSLGCLELDEDDVGLYTFVCPGKYDYGQILRENLQLIENEG